MSSISCIKQKDNTNYSIQLWHYRFAGCWNENYAEPIIQKIRTFCKVRDITLELLIYNSNELTLENYTLNKCLAPSFFMHKK